MTPHYPARDRYQSSGFGWASDCLHIAVNHDDAEGFMKYLAEAGGLDVEVLVAGSIINYAAIHGATKCVEALALARSEWSQPIDYYRKLAESPSYGPRARKLA